MQKSLKIGSKEKEKQNIGAILEKGQCPVPEIDQRVGVYASMW